VGGWPAKVLDTMLLLLIALLGLACLAAQAVI
jgi:hypothetical protein